MEFHDETLSIIAQVLEVQGQMLAHQKITVELQKTVFAGLETLKARCSKVEQSLGKILAIEEAKKNPTVAIKEPSDLTSTVGDKFETFGADSNKIDKTSNRPEPLVERKRCIWHIKSGDSSRRSLNFKARECGWCPECRAQAERKIRVARKPTPSAVVKLPPGSEDQVEVYSSVAKMPRKRIKRPSH